MANGDWLHEDIKAIRADVGTIKKGLNDYMRATDQRLTALESALKLGKYIAGALFLAVLGAAAHAFGFA